MGSLGTHAQKLREEIRPELSLPEQVAGWTGDRWQDVQLAGGRGVGWAGDRWQQIVHSGQSVVQNVTDGRRREQGLKKFEGGARKRLTLDRTAEFWIRSVGIYTDYKVSHMLRVFKGFLYCVCVCVSLCFLSFVRPLIPFHLFFSFLFPFVI